MIRDEKIRGYALKNAIQYDGKAKVESVLSGLFHEGLKKSEVGKVIDDVKMVVSEVNKLSREEQKKQYELYKVQVDERDEREGLPELPLTKEQKKKGVRMRFAPSASGPLHIGHVITAMPSSLYVRKYKGKFYIRIEDTNPENILPEAYDLIKQDCDWLFDKFVFQIQSDRMKYYYQYAEKLIKKDKAYVCVCSQKKIQKLRKKGIECSCRQFPVKEHLERWKKMLGHKNLKKRGYKQGKALLRFKGDMQDKNPALRDFPLARIKETEHPRQGKKYRVWPLMDLAVSVDDIKEKMTHIIRGKDHRDNAKRQEMIFQVFKKKYPYTRFIGRLHFKDLELSTSKMREGIKKKKYKGWDDEKLLTVRSLKKQGYSPKVFESLVEQRGLSEVDKVMNKKDFFQLLKNI